MSTLWFIHTFYHSPSHFLQCYSFHSISFSFYQSNHHATKQKTKKHMDWKEIFLMTRSRSPFVILIISVLILLLVLLIVETDGAPTKTKTKTIQSKTKTFTLYSRTRTASLFSRTKTASLFSNTKTKSLISNSPTKTLQSNTPTLVSKTSTVSSTRSVSHTVTLQSLSRSLSLTKPLTVSSSVSENTATKTKTLSAQTETATKSGKTPTPSKVATKTSSQDLTPSDKTPTISDDSQTLSETYNLSLSSTETWTPTVSAIPSDSDSQTTSISDVTLSLSNDTTESDSASLTEGTISGTASPNQTLSGTISESKPSGSRTKSAFTFTLTNSSELTETQTEQQFPPYNSALEDISVAIAGASVSVGLLSTIFGGASPLTVLAAQRVQMLATFRKCRRPDREYKLSVLESPTQMYLSFGVDVDTFRDSEEVEAQKNAAAYYTGAAVGNSLVVLGLWFLFWLVARYKTVSKHRNLAETLNNLYAPPFLTVCSLVLWQPTVEGALGAAAFAFDGNIPQIVIGAVIFLVTLLIWIGLFYKTMWHSHYRPRFLWKRVQEDGGLLKKGDWDPFYWHCIGKPMPPPRRDKPENPWKVLLENLIYRNGEWRVEDKVLRGVHKPVDISNLPSVGDKGARPLAAVMAADAGNVNNRNEVNAENKDSSSSTTIVNIKDEQQQQNDDYILTRHDYFWWRNAHDAFFFFVTDRARWFFIIEWGVSLLWGVLNLVARRRSCTLGATLLFLPMIIYLVLLLWKRPFCVVFDNLTITFIAILLCVCIALVALAMNADGLDAFPIFSQDSGHVQLMETVLLVTVIIILLRAISDVVRIIRTLIRDREHQKENEIKKKEQEEKQRQKELEEKLLQEQVEEWEEAEAKRLREIEEEERLNAMTLVEAEELNEAEEELKNKEEEDNLQELEEAEAAANYIAGNRPLPKSLRKKKKLNKKKKKLYSGASDDDDDGMNNSSSDDEYGDDDDELEEGKSYAYDYDGTLREAPTISDASRGSMMMSKNSNNNNKGKMSMNPSEPLVVDQQNSSSANQPKLQRGRAEDEMGVDEEELETLPEKVKRMYDLDRIRARQIAEQKRIQQYQDEMNFNPDDDEISGGGNNSNKPKMSLGALAMLKNRIPRKRPPRPMDPKEIHRTQNSLAFVPRQTRKVNPKKLDDVVGVSSYLWMDDSELPSLPDDPASSSSSSSSHSSRASSAEKKKKDDDQKQNKPSAAPAASAPPSEEKKEPEPASKKTKPAPKSKKAPASNKPTTTTANNDNNSKSNNSKSRDSPPKELSVEDSSHLPPVAEVRKATIPKERVPPPPSTANKSPPRKPPKKPEDDEEVSSPQPAAADDDEALLLQELDEAENNSPGTAPATPQSNRKNTPPDSRFNSKQQGLAEGVLDYSELDQL